HNLAAASAKADPLFKAIQSFAAEHPTWTGTATDLNLPTPDPLTPRALSHRLRRLQSTLANHGIEIEFHRQHGGVRNIAIRLKPRDEQPAEICVTPGQSPPPGTPPHDPQPSRKTSSPVRT